MTRGSSWIATYRHNTKLPVKRSRLAESSSSSFQAVGPSIGLRPILSGQRPNSKINPKSWEASVACRLEKTPLSETCAVVNLHRKANSGSDLAGPNSLLTLVGQG